MPRNVHSQIYWGYHSNSRGNRATLYMDILAIQTRTDQAEFNFNLIWFPDEHINNKTQKKKIRKKDLLAAIRAIKCASIFLRREYNTECKKLC